jgi:hypothetical protein
VDCGGGGDDEIESEIEGNGLFSVKGDIPVPPPWIERGVCSSCLPCISPLSVSVSVSFGVSVFGRVRTDPGIPYPG